MAEIIRLEARSPRAQPDVMAFHACSLCRNKTFTLTEDRVDGYPLMRCAACGQHMGRVGWAHDGNPQPVDEVRP